MKMFRWGIEGGRPAPGSIGGDLVADRKQPELAGIEPVKVSFLSQNPESCIRQG
jgi:hypothetical protein